MAAEYVRTTIHGKYHRLAVLDCPIEILERLTREADCDVTVENVFPERRPAEWVEIDQALFPGEAPARHAIRNQRYDVALSNAEFVSRMTQWDRNGVAAIFTRESPIPFRATDLPDSAQLSALEKFGFVLLFLLAGPSSSGESVVVAEDQRLIDIATNMLNED